MTRSDRIADYLTVDLWERPIGSWEGTGMLANVLPGAPSRRRKTVDDLALMTSTGERVQCGDDVGSPYAVVPSPMTPAGGQLITLLA